MQSKIMDIKGLLQTAIDKGIKITFTICGRKKKVDVENKVEESMDNFYKNVDGGKDAVHKTGRTG